MLGLVGLKPGAAACCASKGAVVLLTKQVAVEYGKDKSIVTRFVRDVSMRFSSPSPGRPLYPISPPWAPPRLATFLLPYSPLSAESQSRPPADL